MAKWRSAAAVLAVCGLGACGMRDVALPQWPMTSQDTAPPAPEPPLPKAPLPEPSSAEAPPPSLAQEPMIAPNDAPSPTPPERPPTAIQPDPNRIEQEFVLIDGMATPGQIDRRVRADAVPREALLYQAAQTVGLVVSVTTQGEDDRQRSVRDIGAGVLVSPCLLLTAQHVLGPPLRSGGSRQIEIRFPLLVDSGDGSSFFGAEVAAEGGNGVPMQDWALIRLDRPIPDVTALELADMRGRAFAGQHRLVLVGFPADRFDPIAPMAWVDPDCGRLNVLANGILSTRCQATLGNSGGPLLELGETGWRVTGVLTRAPEPYAVRAGHPAYAVPIHGTMLNAIGAAEPNRCGATPDEEVRPAP
jgi:V8-like Glu-specific endopeptidase